jgi:hypothetical protein
VGKVIFRRKSHFQTEKSFSVGKVIFGRKSNFR